jgi:(2R)-3-sulfolactate dehydrogenase (NADP+)
VSAVAAIPVADLEGLAKRALERAGASLAMARCAAASLVAADSEGIASHGVSRVPLYCAQLRNGRVDGTAVPEVIRGDHAACLVDARTGMAFSACELAVNEAVRRAKQFGVSFAAVTNSNHFGVAAHHLRPVAEAGLVGLAFSNSPAAMPAWGGKRPLFGTNPIAAVFPRRSAPALVIDLSLSEVARGKIMVAAREGRAIPEGWALDKDGKPTTDPKAALEGSMLPAGGVKGAMLALTVELLVCALGGANFGYEADSFLTEEGRPSKVGQAFLVIDPGSLAGSEAFLDRVEALVAAMMEGTEVRLPGARRIANRELAARDGVRIPEDLAAKLRELAGEAAA